MFLWQACAIVTNLTGKKIGLPLLDNIQSRDYNILD